MASDWTRVDDWGLLSLWEFPGRVIRSRVLTAQRLDRAPDPGYRAWVVTSSLGTSASPDDNHLEIQVPNLGSDLVYRYDVQLNEPRDSHFPYGMLVSPP